MRFLVMLFERLGLIVLSQGISGFVMGEEWQVPFHVT
jgi:hypothetical protein